VVDRQVRHLVVADPALGEAGFQWVRAVCRQHGVRMHRYVEQLVDCDEGLEPAEPLTFALGAASNGNGHAVTNGNGHTSNGNGVSHVLTNGNGSGRGLHAAGRDRSGS